MNGPGRYADIADGLRKRLPAKGIVLIVAGGPVGDGFEIAMPTTMIAVLPKVLREVADKLEQDLSGLLEGKRG